MNDALLRIEHDDFISFCKLRILAERLKHDNSVATGAVIEVALDVAESQLTPTEFECLLTILQEYVWLEMHDID